MLSISGTASSKILLLIPDRLGGVRRESRCIGPRPPGRLRDSGVRLTGRATHPLPPSSHTPPHPSGHGRTPLAVLLSSTAAGRSRHPVLQSGKPARNTVRLRFMALFHTGSPHVLPERVRDTQALINDITHPASLSIPLLGQLRHRSSLPLTGIMPETGCLQAVANARNPSGGLRPQASHIQCGSDVRQWYMKPSLSRNKSVPERRAEMFYRQEATADTVGCRLLSSQSGRDKYGSFHYAYRQIL